jgi:hypothetical protein
MFIGNDIGCKPRVLQVEYLRFEQFRSTVIEDQFIGDPHGGCEIGNLAPNPAHSYYRKARHLVTIWVC